MGLVVMVVANDTALTGAETKLKGLLEGAGHTVEPQHQSDAGGVRTDQDLTIVMHSVGAASPLLAGYRTQAIPLIVFTTNSDVVKALGLVNTNGTSTNGSVTGITIVDDAEGHPLAGGLAKGTHTFSASTQTWASSTDGNWGSAETKIATRNNSSIQYVIVHFGQGDQMPGGGGSAFNAPAARTFYGASEGAIVAGNDTCDAHILNACIVTGSLSNALTAGTASVDSFTHNTATVSVTAPTGGTPPYTNQYHISEENDFVPDGTTALGGSQTSPKSITGLTPETQYYVKVVQTDSDGSSVVTNQVTFTTTAAPDPGIEEDLGLLDGGTAMAESVAVALDLVPISGGSAMLNLFLDPVSIDLGLISGGTVVLPIGSPREADLAVLTGGTRLIPIHVDGVSGGRATKRRRRRRAAIIAGG